MEDKPENKYKELLNHFKSVYSQFPSSKAELQIIIGSQGPRCLEDMELAENDVIGSIDLCPSYSSPGPDGPVTAVFECGDKSSPRNCRPITYLHIYQKYLKES